MMIWVVLLGLAVVALAPLAWVLFGQVPPQGRRDAALALHRAQLAELDRDRAEGRLAGAEHAQARLEVQRRMLAADVELDAPSRDETQAPARDASRAVLLGALFLLPAAALALYLIDGNPGLPSEPMADRIAAGAAASRQEAALIAQLQAKLAKLDPHSDQARQGYVLLGNADAGRGEWGAAADAWNQALSAQFDPALAAETAEAMTRAAGGVTMQAASLFRRALDAAPADAPWRPMAEARLAESEKPK